MRSTLYALVAMFVLFSLISSASAQGSQISVSFGTATPVPIGQAVTVAVTVKDIVNSTVQLTFVGLRFDWDPSGMFFIGGGSEKGAVLAAGEQITYPILVTVPGNITPGTYRLSAYITYRLQFQNGTWTGSLVVLWVIPLPLAYPPTQQSQTTTGGESPQTFTNIETVGVLVAVVAIGLFLERAHLIGFIGKHRVTKPGPAFVERYLVNPYFVVVVSLAVYVCLALWWHSDVLFNPNLTYSFSPRILENTTGDEVHYIMVAMNLANYYSPFIETTYRKIGWPFSDCHCIPAIDGHFVSIHGIGLPLLIAVPVKLGGALGAILASTVVMAATNFYVYKLVENYTRNRKIALLTALIMAFSTPMLVYSIQVYTEIYAGLIVTFATYEFLYGQTTRPRAALLGAMLGYLPLLRYDYLVLSLLLGAYGILFKLRKKKPELILFTVAMVVMFCAVPIYQFIAFGNPFAMTASFEFIYHFPAGMLVGAAGQLVDGVHGLFTYAPLFYLLILGLPFFLRKHDGKVVAAIVCTKWLMMSAWVVWDGGWCYASRFLVAVMPLLSLPLAETIQRFRAKRFFVISAAILVAYGLLVNSVSVYFRSWWGGYSLAWISSRLFTGFNALDFLPRLSQYSYQVPTTSYFPPTYDWIIISVVLFLVPFGYFLKRLRDRYLRIALTLTALFWDLSLLDISLNITSWSTFPFPFLSSETPANALFLLGVFFAANFVTNSRLFDFTSLFRRFRTGISQRIAFQNAVEVGSFMLTTERVCETL